MGISRSVTMVAAYRQSQHSIGLFLISSHSASVIQTHSHTAEMALAHLRTRRVFVRPNPGYTEQLEIYSKANGSVVEASTEWANRKIEMARVEGMASRGRLTFVQSVGLRVYGWFARKTKRTIPDNKRHENIKVAEPTF